jgi:citrate lyase subunit beta/citryl-CoA lyase
MLEDVSALRGLPLTGVVVPMIRSADDVSLVEAALASEFPDEVQVIYGLETGPAVERVSDILDRASLAVAVYFGAEDFATDIGLIRSRDSNEILYARSRIALAAANRGLHAIDKGVIDLRDDEQFVADCAIGRGLGYTGKICVAPGQVRLANQHFLPSEDEVAAARRLLVAFEASLAEGRSAPEIDGQMIDGPLVVRARKLLRAAGDPGI